MNLDKLKEAARKFEQREEWRRAIDVYLQAIREAEDAGGEGTQDPALYNRVGDLEMKAGDSLAALRAYEQAAELYADQGFFNNSIALCGKILRVNPSRTATYLRLAQLHARKNFVGEAKKNLLEYLERMDGVGQLEEAFAALKLFADQFSANPDIRMMLVELLRASSRTEEAKEQLEKLAGELEARGDSSGARRTRERLHEIAEESPGALGTDRSGNDLVFLDTSVDATADSETVEAVEGLVVGMADEVEAGAELGAASLDPALAIGGETGGEEAWNTEVSPVDGLDLVALDPTDALLGSALDNPIPMLDLEEGALDLGEDLLGDDSIVWLVEGSGEAALSADSLASIDATEFDDIDQAVAARLPASTATVPPMPVPSPADLMFLQLEDAVASADPSLGEDRGAALLERARQVMDAGDREGGVKALDEALGVFETEGRWEEALRVSGDLLRLEPEAIARYQKQVEIGYRSGQRSALVDAYLELADALVRMDAADHAVPVYRRVLEHDPGNESARAAISLLVADPVAEAAAPPSAAAGEPDGGFIDLGALILDEQQTRDTRMRVGGAYSIDNEDEAFHEALADFKRGIEQNLDANDYQAHYDLGIAFKEMGLLDEAIAQFQKALRSPEGRLKTSEQLGAAFFEKQQFAIAEAVMRRAVDGLPGADDDKIGLLYWLGRSLESQLRGREALSLYERALAVDIRFLDLGERVKRLTAEAAR
jgi:tetratricopeptide (TPR) repeat protein